MGARYQGITTLATPLLQPDSLSTPQTDENNDDVVTLARSDDRPRSVITTEASSSSSVVAKAFKVAAMTVTATIAAAIIAAVLSGLVQDYARRRRYRAGGGAFWNWLACLPSLRYPKPLFYRVSHMVNGAHRGTIDTDDLYNKLSLVPFVFDGPLLLSLDDWGGFTRFMVNDGTQERLVTWIDTALNTFGVIDMDGKSSVLRTAELSECIDLVFKTEALK